MKNFLFIFFILLSLGLSVFCQENEMGDRNYKITRLKPSEFKLSEHCPKMPLKIVNYLNNLGCTIPQSNLTKNNHNAFQGEFVKSGQFDWAVLCSRNNFSSILMFWNSQTDKVSEFAKFPDSDFIRGKDKDGKALYVRAIGKDTLQKLSENDQKLYAEIFPKLNFWGIDEVTPDGKSIIYYIYDNQFVILDNVIEK